MDPYVLPKEEILFLRVYHHISNAVYRLQLAWRWGEAVSACALLSADSWFDVRQEIPTPKLKTQISFQSRNVHSATDTASHFKGLPSPLADHYRISELQNYYISYLKNTKLPVSLCVTHRQRESRDNVYSFFVSTLDDDEWSASHPDSNNPWQRNPSTHWIGVGNQWVWDIKLGTVVHKL